MEKEKYIYRNIEKYVNLGFSIIPVKKDKSPFFSWKDFQKRKATLNEVKNWFKKYSEANIAIITGKISDIVVVDFDSEEAVNWAKKNNLLNTLCVMTARGLHAYYKYPENGNGDIQNAINLNGMKIDIRADGGYVIAPPSIHKSGKLYEFIDENKEIAPLPDIFLRSQKNKVSIVEKPKPISECYKGSEHGERNVNLTRVVGSWIADGLSYEETLKFAYIMNKNNKPPLKDKEVEKIVRSIYNTHMSKKKPSYFYHEKNFLYLPLFIRSSNRQKIKDKHRKIYLNIKTGKTEKTWEVIPSEKYGHCGVFDELVFTAILKIASQQKRPIQNEIEIKSFSEIAKLLNMDTGGKSLQKIKDSIKRIRGLQIYTSSIFYDYDKKRYIEDNFNIFDRYIFKGEITNGEKVSTTNYIFFSQPLIDNLNSNYVKKIDFSLLKRFNSPVTRGLYKLICAKTYEKDNKKFPIRISYSTLCVFLGIKQGKSESLIKNQLDRPHKELKDSSVISNVKISKKTNSKDFYITYIPV